MDGEDPLSTIRKHNQQSAALRKAIDDSPPKSQALRDVSQFGRAASLMISQSALGELLQLAAPCIGYDLAIPVVSVKARKPRTQYSQLIFVQRGDLLFQLLNAAHSTSVSRVSSRVDLRELPPTSPLPRGRHSMHLVF